MTDALRVDAASGSRRRSGGGQLPSWFGLPFILGGVLVAALGFVLLQALDARLAPPVDQP